MRGRIFAVGLVAFVVSILGGLGGQLAGYLQQGYGNCGNCIGSAPQPSSFAIPLDVAYLLLAIGILAMIAGYVSSPKVEAT